MNRGDNQIIDSYTAMVNGKRTGLAGCSNADKCEKSGECLRTSPMLELLHAHECGKNFDFQVAKNIALEI